MPGLWDAHVHMAQWESLISRLDVSGTDGPDVIVASGEDLPSPWVPALVLVWPISRLLRRMWSSIASYSRWWNGS